MGADESLRTCDLTYVASIKGSVVHHTVNSNSYAEEDVPRLLRGIYAYHVDGNGWCDVGCNFFVDRFGRLFEGRYGGVSKNVVGAQAQGFNSQTVGISSLATTTPPPPGPSPSRRRCSPRWGSSSRGRAGSPGGTRPPR